MALALIRLPTAVLALILLILPSASGFTLTPPLPLCAPNMRTATSTRLRAVSLVTLLMGVGGWTSSGSSNAELVKNLEKDRRFESDRVKDAMLKVDRKFFVPHGAYQDSPQPIGHGATISAPHMHAYVLEALEGHLTPGANVLDVGCGSGYLLATFAHMVQKDGRVWGVEHVPELAELSRRNVGQGLCEELLKTVTVQQGDGRLGLPEAAPFDAIHVGAAAESVPRALAEQLKPGGRMIIPVGPEHKTQELLQIDKDHDGNFYKRSLMGVRYIPLTEKDYQLRARTEF
mmetsp:Transcript_11433/g.28047  ORF Transcript_11433/g.28047 Transcript_11433/m.28047 type:complete len:288 (+) Transcript_11433:68-931(+)